MTNVKKIAVEVKEEDAPELHVVVAVNDASKKAALSAPLVVASRCFRRPPRPELAVLGWSSRAMRLGART
jgi:hypothetical protein